MSIIAAQALLSCSQTTFDFVIIGGGTAGLTVAGRLSEREDISVAVIEPGTDQRNNPNVTNVDKFLLFPTFNTSVDWQYPTVNQVHADNRIMLYHQGRALGGTSTINGMTYIRGQDKQFDAWETAGNPGWNWNSLLQYFKKAEQFFSPSRAQAEAGASYAEDVHGYRGPLTVGYPYMLTNETFFELMKSAWAYLGTPANKDLNSGNVKGFAAWPQTLNRTSNLRQDAARAYYYPVQGRSNLHVFNGQATKIIWSEQSSESGEAKATGVQYSSLNGTTAMLLANKEVIVSAGALRSPGILEHSGVGNPDTKVALSAVGENLQDQPMVGISYSGNVTLNGIAPYAAFLTDFDLFGNSTNAVAALSKSSLREWAEQASSANNNAVNASALNKLFEIQHDVIFSQHVPFLEMLPTSYMGAVLIPFWTLLPFSRGSVHIKSPNPLVYPEIDPQFFLNDFDKTVAIAASRLARRFFATYPISSIAVSEVQPGLMNVPENATDEQWMEWIASIGMLTFSELSFQTDQSVRKLTEPTAGPNYHPLATMSMLPRELGGVVDSNLTVYGTSNVRVVDASVIPFQVSGHLTATIYAIAERVADIIKSSY
ncbi:MAG: hypothetical protein Q9227_003726 [Pyrenula ochraceoflavens]